MGWGVSYPNFLDFLYIFYIYKAPKDIVELALQQFVYAWGGSTPVLQVIVLIVIAYVLSTNSAHPEALKPLNVRFDSMSTLKGS